MNFSFSEVFAGILFGSVGLFLFTISKRRANHSVLIISMVLMVYPYFVSGPWLDWGVGLALCAAAYYLCE